MVLLIDLLWLDAAVFVIGVTGCIIYGAVSELVRGGEERQRRELEAISDKLLEDMFWGRIECRYHFRLIADEMHRRRDKSGRETITVKEARELLGLPVFGYGSLSPNEARQIWRNTQFANGNGNTNVIGSNNIASCGFSGDNEWEEVRFYEDDRLYMRMRVPTVPSTYGTEERK